MEITKEQVQEWTREEWARLEREKQEKCDHNVSGKLQAGVMTCDDCGAICTVSEYYDTGITDTKSTTENLGKPDQKAIDDFKQEVRG